MRADNGKCFACDRRLDERFEYVLVAGEQTTVPVGMNCYRKVKRIEERDAAKEGEAESEVRL